MRPLFAGEHLAAYLPRGHALSAKKVLEPADLAGETLITFPREPNPPLYDHFLSSFGEAGYNFKSVEEAGGLNARDLMVAVAERSGVALWPEIGEGSELSTIVVARSLDPPVTMPDTVIAWAKLPERLPGSVIENMRDLADALRGASDPDAEPDQEVGRLDGGDSGIGASDERTG
jgi:hypothetical protein